MVLTNLPAAKPRVLILDDEQEMAALLKRGLERQQLSVTAVTSVQAAYDLLKAQAFEVVLTDLGMTEASGIQVCEEIGRTYPELPVIVITAQDTVSAVVDSLRAGAFDFHTKPVNFSLLALTIDRAVSHQRLVAELRQLKQRVSKASASTMIGDSTPMKKLDALIKKVATSETSVLIHGETGTGKELVARAIHDASNRRKKPFIAVNCAAVPLMLIESELFGHARGAFTDAHRDREGLFVQASGGTLFLDEIGELPMEIQPKLLRALQERKVRPVGSNQEIAFDIRLVSASNRDLEQEVTASNFREDLFYRVNVVTVELPPLRARASDVLLLAHHFVRRFAAALGKEELKLSPSAAEKLVKYDWPGNVRELENCLERAVAFARFDQLTIEDLPERIRAYRADSYVASANDATEVMPFERVEERYIQRVFALTGQDKAKTAGLLGIDKKALSGKLQRYASRTPAT